MLSFTVEAWVLLDFTTGQYDPKQAAKTVKKWIINNKLRLLLWLSQSSDLNPFKNLGLIVKSKLSNCKFSNAEACFAAFTVELNLIIIVNLMPKKIKAKEYLTEY